MLAVWWYIFNNRFTAISDRPYRV